MENEKWTLVTNDNKEIQFSKEFVNFAKLLEDKNIDEVVPVTMNFQTMKIVKQFIEAHRYDAGSIKIAQPIISNNPADNMDPITRQVLELPNDEALFDSVLIASYYLDFPILKKACLAILATHVYIGDNEGDFDAARHKYNLKELSPQEELQIMQEYSQVFEGLQIQFRNKLQSAEEHFRLNQQQ